MRTDRRAVCESSKGRFVSPRIHGWQGEESARREARVRGHVSVGLESASYSKCAEARACARVSGVWALACAAEHCNVQVLAVLAVQRIMQSSCVYSVATRLAAANVDGVCGIGAEEYGGLRCAPVAGA